MMFFEISIPLDLVSRSVSFTFSVFFHFHSFLSYLCRFIITVIMIMMLIITEKVDSSVRESLCPSIEFFSVCFSFKQLITIVLVTGACERSVKRSGAIRKPGERERSLLCPQTSSTSIELEMTHVIDWARENKMTVNLLKTVELVFRRPSVSNDLLPAAVSDYRRIAAAKLLGVHFTQNLTFSQHVDRAYGCDYMY